MNIFKYQVKIQPGIGRSKNAKDKDIGVNPNRDADSSFSKSVHSNKTQNIFKNIFQKRCCIKVSKKATSEKMLPHCFARSYIQFHLKKEVSWHLSTSTGKWPCRRRRRRCPAPHCRRRLLCLGGIKPFSLVM